MATLQITTAAAANGKSQRDSGLCSENRRMTTESGSQRTCPKDLHLHHVGQCGMPFSQKTTLSSWYPFASHEKFGCTM